ncbi:MAG: flagellar basal body P-ring protein FlgI [Gammaproteobacteria bacterium]|nr:flagellar basal body P-ring protein FlgI [Gammaproteobacteria bacterium]
MTKNRLNKTAWFQGVLALLVFLFAGFVQAERIKDITSVAGVRSNQLIGYGLVVGLNGTGDQTTQTPFTIQSIKSMLAQFGVTLPPDSNPQLKNIAAVVVHAELPAFAKVGQKIDITVSSLGNAKSLRGGSLLMAPLKGADNKVYAVAQGNLVVGGFGASGNDGSSITVNIPSVGRVPNGAIVERTVQTSFAQNGPLVLNLHNADFTTAIRITDVINESVGKGTAKAIDASSVRVSAPYATEQRVAFVSLIENLNIHPGESAAKVIINSRTGTVVIGQNVRVMPAAISHGNLTVTITSKPIVSQPGPLAGGSTVVVPTTDIEIKQENKRMFLLDTGVSLNEVVQAVNQVGAAPGDLVAILEALKQSGALKAELIVI